MHRWFVARREDPSKPLVEVRFERPWVYLFLVQRCAVVPLEGPDASAIALAVETALTSKTPLLYYDGRWITVQPPHTRSARQVDLALRLFAEKTPALAAWKEGSSRSRP